MKVMGRSASRCVTPGWEATAPMASAAPGGDGDAHPVEAVDEAESGGVDRGQAGVDGVAVDEHREGVAGGARPISSWAASSGSTVAGRLAASFAGGRHDRSGDRRECPQRDDPCQYR
jgi:hypothetical protein